MLFVLQALISSTIQQHDGPQQNVAVASAKVDVTLDAAPICDSGSGQQQNHCNHTDCAICTSQTDRQTALFIIAAAIAIVTTPEERRGAEPTFADTVLPNQAIDIAAGAPRAPPTFS